jgi:hypothetical protein
MPREFNDPRGAPSARRRRCSPERKRFAGHPDGGLIGMPDIVSGLD